MSQAQFQIHAPGIDVSQLNGDIEATIKKAGFSKEEINMVEELDFKPVSPIQEMAFNPPLTCEQYERSVEMPDFSSRKYSYVFGPFKWFVKKIYKQLSLVYERNSKNKVQSFYNVVHELIYLRRRIDWLESKKNTSSNSNDNLVSESFLRPESKYMCELLNAVYDQYKSSSKDSLLILDDLQGQFTRRALKSGFKSITCNSKNADVMHFFGNHEFVEVEHGSCETLFLKNKSKKYSHCIVADSGNYSGNPETLFENLCNAIESNAIVSFINISGNTESGFIQNNQYQLDEQKIIQSAQKNGFELSSSIKINELGDKSFLLILKKA